MSRVGEGLRRSAGVVDEVDARGVRDGQRLQHQGVEYAEHHRVRADPQRQRQDRDERERRTLAQHAEGEPGVLRELFQPSPSPHISAPFLQAGWVPEAPQGGVARLLGVCAVGAIGIRLHRGVEPQFLFDLGIELPAAAEKYESPPQFTQVWP